MGSQQAQTAPLSAESFAWTTIEQLSEHYLGGLPSPAALKLLAPLAQQRDEVRAYVERVFRLMALSRVDVRDVSPVIGWSLGVMIPRILPGAWGGVVPPITMEGRHRQIDDYLERNPYAVLGPGTVMLDVGCGFPPHTAVDTARRFPEWKLIGADPAFDHYLVYDERGNYACLDSQGKVRYFQAGADLANWENLFADRAATMQRFSTLFEHLLPGLPADGDGQLAVCEEQGARLVRHPLRLYALPNLSLLQAGLGSAGFPQADLIRCFNVLVYYDQDFRGRAEAWVGRMLRPGGLFVCGMNAPRNGEARYTVYQKDGNELVDKEFAFSLDNLRTPSGTAWFSLHDGDRETWRLAMLAGILQADDDFRRDFGTCLDRLREEKGMGFRGSDGYWNMPIQHISPQQWEAGQKEILRQLDELGFIGRAISVLNSAGFRAWRNGVGHIAVDPAGFRADHISV